jgi:short subunit dehydrogenase-like uncharacterized protein
MTLKRFVPVVPPLILGAMGVSVFLLWSTRAHSQADRGGDIQTPQALESPSSEASRICTPAVKTDATNPAVPLPGISAAVASPPTVCSHPSTNDCSTGDSSLVRRQLDAARSFALGMIETGNEDNAVGRAGEVSRYQIMPSVWRHYTTSAQHQDPEVALEIARQHWAWLYDYFKHETGREPTDFDMYVLWNTRHGYYANRAFNPSQLHPLVRDRAERFTNLVEEKLRREARLRFTASRE